MPRLYTITPCNLIVIITIKIITKENGTGKPNKKIIMAFVIFSSAAMQTTNVQRSSDPHGLEAYAQTTLLIMIATIIIIRR